MAGRPCGLSGERAGEFGVRPDRVGMIGFSAGGVVTSEALFGPPESRTGFRGRSSTGSARSATCRAPSPPLFLAVAADDAHGGQPDSRDVQRLAEGQGSR